ncbi:MAG: hypothetical protein R3F59_27150 [Myxococcota bacterium]
MESLSLLLLHPPRRLRVETDADEVRIGTVQANLWGPHRQGAIPRVGAGTVFAGVLYVISAMSSVGVVAFRFGADPASALAAAWLLVPLMASSLASYIPHRMTIRVTPQRLRIGGWSVAVPDVEEAYVRISHGGFGDQHLWLCVQTRKGTWRWDVGETDGDVRWIASVIQTMADHARDGVVPHVPRVVNEALRAPQRG